MRDLYSDVSRSMFKAAIRLSLNLGIHSEHTLTGVKGLENKLHMDLFRDVCLVPALTAHYKIDKKKKYINMTPNHMWQQIAKLGGMI